MEQRKAIPELIERTGDAYEVNTLRGDVGLLNGNVDKQRRVMNVPGAPTCDAQWVRRHELMHVAISPKQPKAIKGATSDDMRMSEDMRINHAVQYAYVDSRYSGIRLSEQAATQALEMLAGYLKANAPVDAAALVLWSRVFSFGIEMREALRRDTSATGDAARHVFSTVESLYDETIQTSEKIVPSYRRFTVPLARMLSSFRRELDDKQDKRSGKQDGEPGDAEPGDDAPGESPFGNDGDARAGDMSVVQPPLNVPHTGALRALSRKYSATSGARLRRVDRLKTDGAVFVRRKRAPGGTVLVDTSGSMSLSYEDVRAVLDAAPGATVATYHARGVNRYHHGTLHVIARNGRMANEDDVEAALGGCNVVDLPALEWLGKQAGPRLWVSDGVVTGVCESQHPLYVARCFATAQRVRAKRVETCGDAVAYLKSARR